MQSNYDQPLTEADASLRPKAPKWDTISQSQKFLSLAPDQQDAVRNKYFDDFVAPRVPEGQIDTYRARWGEITGASQEVPERTWGEAVKDTGLATLQGGIGAVQGAAQMGELAFRATQKPSEWAAKTAGAVANTLGHENNWGEGAESLTQSVSRGAFGRFMGAAERAKEFYGEKKSESIKAKSQELEKAAEDADGFWDEAAGSARVVWDNPQLLPDLFAQSAAYLVAPGVAARKAAHKVGTGILARGGDDAAARAGASKAATKAGIATGGLTEGASAGVETRAQVMDMTPEQLIAQSDAYQQLIDKGMGHDEAIYDIAFNAGLTAQAISTPISILASKATGAGRVEAEFFTGQGVRNFFSSLGKEFVEEAAQEAGSTFGENVGVRTHADRDQALTEGLGQSATIGGMMGVGQAAGMRGASGLVSGVRDLPASERTNPDAVEAELEGDADVEAELARLMGESVAPSFPDTDSGLATYQEEGLAPLENPVAGEMVYWQPEGGEQSLARYEGLAGEMGGLQIARVVVDGREELVPMQDLYTGEYQQPVASNSSGPMGGPAEAFLPGYENGIDYEPGTLPQGEGLELAPLEGASQPEYIELDSPTQSVDEKARPVMDAVNQNLLDQERDATRQALESETAIPDRPVIDPSEQADLYPADPSVARVWPAAERVDAGNVPDARLTRPEYRDRLAALSSELVKGGGVSYVHDEHGRIIGRTPSENPDWFKAMNENPETIMTVKDTKAAIDKALKGESLGVRQLRVVGAALDAVSDERGDHARQLRAMRENAREDRRRAYEQWLEATNVPLDAEFEATVWPESPGEAYNESDYLPDLDMESRALTELMESADALGVDWAAIDSALAADDIQGQTKALTQLIWDTRNEHRKPARAGQGGQSEAGTQGEPGTLLGATETLEETPADQARRDQADSSPAELTLTTQTEQELSDRASAQQERERAESETRQQEEQRAAADRERDDFVLSGSNSEADQAAARGQGDLLSSTTSVKAEETGPRKLQQHIKANTEANPTEAQKEAGNYRKASVNVQGLDISIENPRGGTRSGVDPDGNSWEVTMHNHYGYIRRSEGADGEHVDVFVGPNPASEKVFIVDQVNPDGSFDEHKVLIGFDSKLKARSGYKSNYSNGWKVGPITSMTMDEFKAWLRDGDTRKPLSDHFPDAGEKPKEPRPSAGQEVESASDSDSSVSGRPEATQDQEKWLSRTKRAKGYGKPEKQKQVGDVTLSVWGENADGDRQIYALDSDGNVVGDLYFGRDDGVLYGSVEVRPSHRRKGIATAMYDFAGEIAGEPVQPSNRHSEDAAAFWADRKAKQDRTALVEALRKQGRITEAAVNKWIDRFGVDGARRLVDAEYNQRTVFTLISNQIAPNKSLMDAVSQDNNLAHYYRASTESVKALDEQAFADLLASDADLNRERTREYSYLVLRHSNQKAETDYIGKVGRMANRFREGSQAPGGKLYKMAQPYLSAQAESSTRQATVKQSSRPVQPIEDAGEKLGGARKDELRTVRERLENMDDEQIASSTLGKLFPKTEIEKVEDKVAAAIYQVARDLIPAKPRKAYRLKRWVDTVRQARELIGLVEEVGPDALLERIEKAGIPKVRDIVRRVEVLNGIDRGQWDRVGVVTQASGQYSKGDEMVPGAWVTVEIDGRLVAFYGHDTIQSALPEIRQRLDDKRPAGKKLKFAVYQDLRAGEYFIAQDSDKEKRRLKTFDSPNEARAYIRDNHDDLVAAWEAVKNRDNVTRADMRRSVNTERTGIDYRDGKDVTPQQFLDAFGFRGVEFGNWVRQGKGAKERQSLLNDAYDSFMDLADVLNIPPKALSLEGTLGIGMGSRGRGGKASAHFEPDSIVINLTKTKGGGSLAHEWFHALDNYFARKRGEPVYRGNDAAYRREAFVTYLPESRMVRKDTVGTSYPLTMSREQLERIRSRSPDNEAYAEDRWIPDPNHKQGIRPVVEKAFAELVKTLDESPMTGRASVIDKGKEDGYWSQIIERAARSFESYIIVRLADRGYRNDFLANVVSADEFQRDPGRYPYLKEDEVTPVAEAFDKLFETVEAKETDSGIALRENEGLYSPYERENTSVREPQGGQSESAQRDLFAPENLPKDTARTQAKDNFNVRFEQVPTREHQVGFTHVTRPDEAAHIFAPIRKHAQESFMVLVTDKDGKILNLIHHTKGLKASSQVSPIEVAGAIASTPGAANVWFGHNHPSGVTRPSQSDYAITDKIVDAMDGMGVEYRGHIIVGDGQQAAFFAGLNDSYSTIDIKPAPRGKTVPVTERMLRKRDRSRLAVQSPDEAFRAVLSVDAKDAVLLLDNQNHLVGTLALSPSEMKLLREDGRVRRVLSSLDKTNAGAIIIKTNDREAALNMARFFNGHDLRVLDWISENSEGDLVSDANNFSGVTSSRGPFFSIARDTVTKPISKGAASKVIDRIKAKSPRADIHLVDSFNDMPADIVWLSSRQSVDGSRVRGVYFEGAIYLNREALRNETEVEQTVFHELYGHHGISLIFDRATRPAMGKLYLRLGGIAGVRKLAEKHGIDLDHYIKRHAKAVKEGGLTREAAQSIIAEELLAHIAQDNKPSIKRAWQEFIGAFRAWLREKGFLQMSQVSNSELMNLLRQARQAVDEGQVTGSGGLIFDLIGNGNLDAVPAFAETPKQTRKIIGDDPVLAGWTMLVQSDGAFQLPTSNKKMLTAIFKDLEGDQGMQIERADELAMQMEKYGATMSWRITTPNGEKATVYQKGKSVWIDVSALKSGEYGKRIYNAVANYAHNTDRTFVGDPDGLSDIALTRRLENMISSALKFGTTKHLWPHDYQLKGNKGMGVPGIQWKDGDDAHNLRQMIMASYEATATQFPKIRDLRYTPKTDRFEDTSNDGREFKRSDFRKLAETARGMQEPGRERPAPSAGQSTLERAVLTNTLSRGTRQEVADILAQFVRLGSKRLTGENAILYSEQADSEPRQQGGVSRSGVDQTDTPAFKKWFGDSKVVDENGQPLVVYHGATNRFTQFETGRAGGIYFTPRRGLAEQYGPHVTGAYLRIERLADLTDPSSDAYAMAVNEFNEAGGWEHNDDAMDGRDSPLFDPEKDETWELFDNPEAGIAQALRDAGYEGVKLNEYDGDVSFVAFRPEQIKSATGNTGAFNPSDPDIRFSIAPDSENQVRDAAKKLGLDEKEQESLIKKASNLINRDWKALAEEAGERAHEGIFDGLIGLDRAERAVGKGRWHGDYARSSFVSAVMATGQADVMHHLLEYGAVQWQDGVLQPVDGTKGFLEIMKGLGPDMQDWLAWMGANRAAELMKQGRENNLTKEDIAVLFRRAAGKLDKFKKAKAEYNKLAKAVLDVTQEAGLINAESRKEWESEWYVPFYRRDESEQGLMAPRTKRGLSHQSSGIKQLKGGKMATNDLLENIMTNWLTLVDASMKNDAMLKAVDNLKDTEFMEAVTEHRGDSDVVRVQRNGQNEYYRVADPSLLRAIKHIGRENYNDPFMKGARFLKRLLTTGVTTSPDFMIRNYIRDAMHAWAINPDGMKLASDSVRGVAKAMKEDQHYRMVVAAGGAFQGGYVHGGDPEASAQLVRRAVHRSGLKGIAPDSVLDTPASMWRAVQQSWQWYREKSDRVENSSRMAVVERGLEAGKPLAQVMFEAKDQMDYARRGNFAAVIILTDIIPFLNARLQGHSKLARSAKSYKRMMAMKAGMMASFSIALAALHAGDDRYDELPDWEKDMYWHFWLPGLGEKDHHWRVPKPFEIGAIAGTIPERVAHSLIGSQENEKLAWSLKNVMMDTFGLHLPQFLLPPMEVAANKSFFFDSPIEGMADQGRMPQARYDHFTSDTMVKLGEWTGQSPKKLEHLLVGYTGTMGAYALGAVDVVTRWATDHPGKPAQRLEDLPAFKTLYRGDSPRSSRYLGELYDDLKAAEEVYRTITLYRGEGKDTLADKLIDKHQDKLASLGVLRGARRDMAQVRNAMLATRNDRSLSAEEKRQQIDELVKLRNEIAKSAVRAANPPKK